MSKTKVLFLAQLPPPVHGVSMMSKQVYDIFYDLEESQVDYLWSGSAKSLNDIDKKNIGKLLGFAKLILTLLFRFLVGKRYNVAYVTFAPWTHAALRDGLLAALAGLSAKRVLLHLHGEGLDKVVLPQNFKNKLLARLVTSTELIAITKQSARLARKSALFSSVHFLPNFVAVPDSNNSHSQQEQHKTKPLKIIFLGNLDPRKGVLRFLNFVASAKKAGLSVKAELVGAPTKFLSLENVVEEGRKRDIDDILSVPGSKYGVEKSEFLASGDIFLYPSLHDYAPLVLIEAMASACVPISFNTGGIAEIMGDDFKTHVVEPSDIETKQQGQVIDLLTDYCNHPARLTSDKGKALAIYEKRFTKEVFIAQFMTILACEAQPILADDHLSKDTLKSNRII